MKQKEARAMEQSSELDQKKKVLDKAPVWFEWVLFMTVLDLLDFILLFFGCIFNYWKCGFLELYSSVLGYHKPLHRRVKNYGRLKVKE